MSIHCSDRRCHLYRRHTRLLGAPLLAVFLSLWISTAARAQFSVDQGWDLFVTETGTSFAGVPFVGVPLGTFDFDNTFGRGLGVQTVGNTDTIIQRNAVASVPGPAGSLPQTAAPIPIEMVALQLVTVAPTAAFGPLDFYYITLQSARGGPASVGQMTIDFNNVNAPPPQQPVNGTFSSFFDVFFDIREGSLTGPIVFSNDLVLTNSGTPWSHYASTTEYLIDGVNTDLDGNNDQLADFHVISPIIESHPSGAQHVARTLLTSDVAPEPGSLLLLLGPVGTLAAIGARGRLRLRRRIAC